MPVLSGAATWFEHVEADANGLLSRDRRYVTTTPGRVRSRRSRDFHVAVAPGAGADVLAALDGSELGRSVRSIGLDDDELSEELVRVLARWRDLRQLSLLRCRVEAPTLVELAVPHLSLAQCELSRASALPIVHTLVVNARAMSPHDAALIVEARPRRLRLWAPITASSLAAVMSAAGLEHLELLELDDSFDEGELVRAMSRAPRDRALELVLRGPAERLRPAAAELAAIGVHVR